MNIDTQTAIIFGATINALITAKTISGLFDNLIIVEPKSEFELSSQEQNHISELARMTNIRFMFNTTIHAYVSNITANIEAAYVQTINQDLEIIHAQVVIDASDLDSNTPLCLRCLGYDEVPYSEKQVMISAPMLHTVIIKSYQYHKMQSLPQGLFIIGNALSNIASLSEQEEKLAAIQAHLLKHYLSTKQSSLKFQKNVARILSIVVKEYIHTAKYRLGIEHHLETRGFATATR